MELSGRDNMTDHFIVGFGLLLALIDGTIMQYNVFLGELDHWKLIHSCYNVIKWNNTQWDNKQMSNMRLDIRRGITESKQKSL